MSSFTNKPNPKDLDKWSDLKNMDKAVSTFAELIKTKKSLKIKVIVDSDADGYTSSAILIQYLRNRFPDTIVNYHLHPGKEHGIVLDYIEDDDDLIFIPDAGSNDYDQQEVLVKQGKTVIVLDHHEINREERRDTGAIIVNNQDSENFSNKSLSGAGVTLMFVKAVEDTMWTVPTELYVNYIDLAAIGIIADAMNMTTLGNNYISYFGLHRIHNNFIKQLASIQQAALKIKDATSLTKMDVMWYIAPIINGVIRSGSPEDKEIVFKALITPNGEEDLYITT